MLGHADKDDDVAFWRVTKLVNKAYSGELSIYNLTVNNIPM